MKKLIVFFIIILAVFSPILLFLFLSSPVSTQPSSTNAFVINEGDSLDMISNRLQQSGFIRNSFVFKLNAYVLGLHTKLRAGTFNLSKNIDNAAIANILSKGGSVDIWIQLLEGWRNEEIAKYFDENKIFSGKSFQYLANGKNGYIFPDTYSIPKSQSIEFFIETATNNFNQKYQQANSQSVDNTKKQEDIVIIASLLEREARSLEAKQMISGIIQNRLAINMPLQIDATVQYAKDSKFPPQKYWQPISRSDLDLVSPFNTYLNQGLPPSPICNPGYNSLFAAINPTDSDYLYYITGKDGKMYYGKTLDEHNSNIQKYL